MKHPAGLQSGRQGGKSALRPVPILGSLLLALAASTPAHAVTSFSVDGQSPPYTFVQGETFTLRMDVGKPGGGVNFRFARDLTGSGKYDPTAPTIGGTSSF